MQEPIETFPQKMSRICMWYDNGIETQRICNEFGYSLSRLNKILRYHRVYWWAYIYALRDPETGKVMYVGTSINPRERLSNHYGEKNHKDKYLWIRALVGKGMKPELVILQRCRFNNRYRREAEWTYRYWRRGEASLNKVAGRNRKRVGNALQ